MSQPRIHQPGFIHLITNRTEHGMYFLTPTRKIVHLIRYWLARAKQLHGPRIEIFAFCFLSNHFHILLRDPCGELPAFIGYFSGNCARAINRAIGRRGGTFWSDAYDDEIIDGDKAFMDVLAYVLANPVKSGLVDLPSQWKGVSALDCMMTGTRFSETGLRRSEYNEAARHGKPVNRGDYETQYSFELSVPPAWQGLSLDSRRQALVELLKSASADYRRKRRNRCAVGMKKILAQSLYEAPKNFTPRPRKKFHCSCEARLRELQAMFSAFVGRYRECMEMFSRQVFSRARKRLARKIAWPPGSYPPSCVKPIPV